MLKELDIRTVKIGTNYISECKVLDLNTQKIYYVVSRMPKVMYAAFESSYIESLKNKIKIPRKIEGENYMFFDFEGRLNNTNFFIQYKKTYDNVLEAMRNDRITKKYSKIKKPKNINDYKIVNKEKKLSYVGFSYKMIIDFNNHVYMIYKDDFSNYKIFEYILNQKILIEELNSFKKIKKSKFYPYYLLIEMYNDNYLMNL